MASLTLKNIPAPLLESLRERAASDRRSLSQEALFLLEEAVKQPARDLTAEDRVRAQVRAWSRLAGRWKSDVSVDEEIEQILGTRTQGRQVDL